MESTAVVSATTTLPGAEGADELAAALRAGLGGRAASLVLVFASLRQPLAALLPALSRTLPQSLVLGASSAGEFTERGDTKHSACAVAIAGDYRVTAGLGTGLRNAPEAAVAASLSGQPSALHGYPHRTAVLLLDPLAGNGEEVTLIAATALGPDVSLAGGAAGDYLAMERTWVGVGERVATDAVVVAQIFSKRPLGIGLSHGHRPISAPITVTRAEGGRVYTLDGRPAWDVWRAHTAEPARARGIDVERLPAGDVPGFLLQYEAGLRVGDDVKIRAPLTLHPDGSIGFACDLPTGSVLRITESEPGRQVESARAAARHAMAGLAGAAPAGAVVFDCICRNLILGERFDGAVRAISDELGGVPIGGFETYGEIALNVGEMSGFHNTTSVVLVFPR
jgi:methyl-accepting chemotaxis protein